MKYHSIIVGVFVIFANATSASFLRKRGQLKKCTVWNLAQWNLILAATNSALYAQTRMIFALITPAKEAQAPMSLPDGKGIW